MTTTRRQPTNLGRLAAGLVACLALATSGEALAAPLLGLGGPPPPAPLAPTAPSQLVTLFTANVPCPLSGSLRIDNRRLPDGSSEPFTVPSGQVLVITAAEVIVHSDVSEIGDVANVFLAAGESDLNILARQDGVIEGGGQNSQGFPRVVGSLTRTWTFPNGVVIGPGVPLCAVALDESFQDGDVNVARAFVHGFLAADR